MTDNSRSDRHAHDRIRVGRKFNLCAMSLLAVEKAKAALRIMKRRKIDLWLIFKPRIAPFRRFLEYSGGRPGVGYN
jgi:hypothetical protein